MNGVGGDSRGDYNPGSNNAPAGEMTAQFFHGAADALLRGVLVPAQHLANRAEITMFKKAQHNRRAVAGVQLVDGFVQQGSNLLKLAFGWIG